MLWCRVKDRKKMTPKTLWPCLYMLTLHQKLVSALKTHNDSSSGGYSFQTEHDTFT